MEVTRRNERTVVGPGQIFTGAHRYACDGAVLSVVWEQIGGGEARPVEAQFEQLHDLNVGRHRTIPETREHLRRCLRMFVREGLLLVLDGTAWFIPAARVGATGQLKLHVFHRTDQASGPFVEG